jgi:carboxylate-amine ligase
MYHRFRGPRFTVGVEEELMILDARSHDLVNGVELLLSHGSEQSVKPELLESVLEISTEAFPRIDQLRDQLAALRREVQARAAAHGLAIGSAGTHPWGLWEHQRIVSRERYEGLVDALRLVVRQELLFGLHVHVGLDDPEAAIAVANGLRLYVPLLLALSANSPFWRGEPSGLMSTRMPIFRQVPRVGIPPYYDGWQGFQDRIDFMMQSGVISDYTYLWFDVRPHPKLGTVEIRAMDAQTRVEDTAALAALSQTLVKQLYERHAAGERASQYPAELLDENKWLAARYGLDAELVDLPDARRVSVRELMRRELPALREHADDLGCRPQLDAVDGLLECGNGAQRQLAAFSEGGTLQRVMAQIVALTAPD